MPNHPNRRRLYGKEQANPSTEQITSARRALQDERQLGITEAQRICASLIYTSLRTWQQWETGDRRMHPAFWELFNLKKG